LIELAAPGYVLGLPLKAGASYGHAMSDIILSSPDIMSGTPCFAGTRVPFQTLLDYLEGSPLAEFLEDFPSVTREQAVAALQQAGDLALAHARVA
jgi:uncharacterized protein (DUF433 family)